MSTLVYRTYLILLAIMNPLDQSSSLCVLLFLFFFHLAFRLSTSFIPPPPPPLKHTFIIRNLIDTQLKAITKAQKKKDLNRAFGVYFFQLPSEFYLIYLLFLPYTP